MDEHSLAAGRAFPWHELYVPDVQKGIDFYVQAFGMETEGFPMGEMGTYHMLKVNGAAVAGVMSTSEGPAQDAPTHWAVYLAVDDVDARVAKVEALGGKVVVPAMDVPTVGRMALIADPQGAHIWLYKPA